MTEYDNANRGMLFRNERKESDSHPDHTGSINVGGVDYWLNAWVKTSKAGKKFFSLSVKPKDALAAAASQPRRSLAEELGDDVPF